MMKINNNYWMYVGLAFSMLMLRTSLAMAESQVVDKIVALVNDKIITQSDVEEGYKEYSKSELLDKRLTPEETKNKVIQLLINEKILMDEMERLNIQVSQEEVDSHIQARAREEGLSVEQLTTKLKNVGLSFDVFKEKIEQELKKGKFLQENIYQRIYVADYDLEEYYKRHANKFVGYDKIRFLEIFLTPQSIPQQTDINKFITRLLDQLKKGTNWAFMAKKYSQGAFAEKGGDSGLMSTSSLQPNLLNILLSLETNVVSNPIPTPNSGIFIFKVIEKQNPSPRPFNDVKEMIRQIYLSERVDNELENYLMEARSRHFVEIRE